MNLLDQLPPHDIEAEEAVLAALMVSKDAVYELADRLTPADFFREQNGWVFAACMDLYAAGQGVNTVTVAHELSTKNRDVDRSELLRMIAQLPTALGGTFYANIVRECATRRHIIQAADGMARLAYSEMEPPEQVLAKTESMIHTLRTKRELGPRTVGPDSPSREPWDEIVEFLDDPKRIRGLQTGWRDLDRLMDGLAPGRLITVGAATSVGKSLFVQNLLRQMAIAKIPSLVFTTEMSAREVRSRLVYMHAGVDRMAVAKRGEATVDERDCVFDSMEAMRQWPIWYCEEAHPSAATIRAEVRRHKELHGVRVGFVDHLGYIEGRGEKEYDRLTDAVKVLKGVAQDEDIPMVAASHVNRAGAGSGDWLKLTDLHAASAIEKDSDQVLLLTPCDDSSGAWMPLSEQEAKAKKGRGELLAVMFDLSKNRHGGYGAVPMLLNWSQLGGRFVPVSR